MVAPADLRYPMGVRSRGGFPVHDGGSSPPAPSGPPRLLDRVRQAARLRHLSHRTETAYVGWIRRFILFHDKRHPRDMGAPEVVAFLTHLAAERHVGATTQNQALSALLFLYRVILGRELEGLDAAARARTSRPLPVVLSRDEVRAVLAQLPDPHRLVATILYGGGLRLLEALRLRRKDLDLERRQLIVRGGKGDRDRRAPLRRASAIPSNATSNACAPSTSATASAASAPGSPARSARSTRTPTSNGAGIGCSRPCAPAWIGAPAQSSATTCTRRRFNAPSSRP